jgi:mersacidin/lichenicidin family type 2 lantibiotic
MTREEIVRAWKDENFRASLDPEALAALPENPAGSLFEDRSAENDAGGQWGPATGWVCLTLVSVAFSCGPCDATIWDGTCGISSVGCCRY